MCLLERIRPSINRDFVKENPGYSIYEGKNDLSTLCEETEVVIIGSFIPQHLIYFYNQSSYIYTSIDLERGTNLCSYKVKKNARLSNEVKEKYISNIKDMLKKEKIAFIDLSKEFITRTGSSKDKDVIEFTIDFEALDIIRNSLNIKKIISISKPVQEILKKYGIDSAYLTIFEGKNKDFPKGTDKSKLWRDVFKK